MYSQLKLKLTFNASCVCYAIICISGSVDSTHRGFDCRACDWIALQVPCLVDAGRAGGCCNSDESKGELHDGFFYGMIDYFGNSKQMGSER